MDRSWTQSAQDVLEQVVTGEAPVPGVAAVVTGRDGTLWEGAAGVRVLGEDLPMTTDTVCAVYSTTKAITATACLQLVEDGRLDLDEPAARHVPELGRLQVLDGFDESGPRLRPPTREITPRMLLLHTAGFGYDFFSEDYARLARDHGQPGVVTAERASLTTPLLFDPGERWEYGSGVDWAGQVVEAVTGQRLGEVVRERILDPLGMASTAFVLTPEMRSRLARIHTRRPDGSLRALTSFELPQDPEVHMGGHALYSTPQDFARFLRMWLADGAGPRGQVLQADTVAAAERDGLGGLRPRPLRGIAPALSHDVDLLPGTPTSWSLAGMVNLQDAATGRRAGSVGWAGLPNLYYWIDRRSGVAGFWATQVLPFCDPTSLQGSRDLETAVYRGLRG